jgi:5'-deoxynucleotidase YfbR-like HD superfamily hydrolase
MSTFSALQMLRHERWGQTPQTHLPDSSAAPALIERVGIATLYPASPEVPNLYHAYVGDPTAKTEAKWDSPSGEVYGWRWSLGRQGVAFYTTLVCRRSTWVSWKLFPAVLRLCAETRDPQELYDTGKLTREAYRITQALEEAGGTLSTAELRKAASFPTGKTTRAAYLKALEELELCLIVAKYFQVGNDDTYHTLIASHYQQYVESAQRLSREAAMEDVLLTYLPQAVYALPTVLARHLRVPEPELRAALDRLCKNGQVAAVSLPEQKGQCYLWQEEKIQALAAGA